MPSSPVPARRLTADQRRAQILGSARELMRDRGLDEVSVESAAQQAGVSPGLLFHYFGSQRGFRDAVVELVGQELLEYIAPDPRLSPSAQLRCGIERFTDFVARHPALYQAVVRHGARGGPGRMATLHRAARATLADWITGAVTGAGAARTPRLELAVAGWLAFMEEAVLGWLAGAALDRGELVELCEGAAYQVLETAVADPARWPAVRAALDRTPHPES
ncbi:TetR/AcrR family transcriptional regulator [Streptomyces sp. TLI_171]|uniref:TetR/AcrR family transcriptional regulator n=1 Tax=Streptomyces sp. TLI_171 TaxID=1938859 RepID=UPI000C19E5C1|nr:TetR/AcrR family transcriptional regulator [Streptomyces sp. TLI_171]RKE22379.1 TetR family transcriptional regulator [Streptomyces sp. TLI_171]